MDNFFLAIDWVVDNYIFVLIVYIIISGMIGGIMADSKGKGGQGFILGALLGVIGRFIILGFGESEEIRKAKFLEIEKWKNEKK